VINGYVTAIRWTPPALVGVVDVLGSKEILSPAGLLFTSTMFVLSAV
jgi:hypothetical protein